jgi:ankyrin repeat protein
MCKFASLPSVGHNKTPALQVAAREGHLSVVKLLHAAGVDCKYGTRQDPGPLSLAAERSYLQIMEALLDAGATMYGTLRVDRSVREPTAIEYVAAYGQENAVKMLLRRGFDPSKSAGRVKTALRDVHQRGHESVIQLLERTGGTSL